MTSKHWRFKLGVHPMAVSNASGQENTEESSAMRSSAVNRREFLKTGVTGGVSLAALGNALPSAQPGRRSSIDAPGSGAKDASDAFPLDPLTEEEIQATVDLLKAHGKVTDRSRFATIVLHEPPKEEVLTFGPGHPIAREAFADVYERDTNQTYEAVVDLTHKQLVSWNEVPGVEPSFLEEDDVLLKHIVKADKHWQEAMRKRGITDFNKVEITSSPAGYYGDSPEVRVRERIATFSYGGNSIEGVVAYADLNHMKVIRFVDTGVLDIPKEESATLALNSVRNTGPVPKPLEIVQPHGPSFTVHGHEVEWQNWHFRFGMNSREGLVLYTVGYRNHGRLRSILYRGALSEMVVPYGDPGVGWFFHNFFDEGEDSMGRYADPLEPGIDCPENASLFNAVFADENGRPFEIPRAIALYERDGGLLWKHFDRSRQKNEARRARELVLSWTATVGNYDYGFEWVFRQNGTLEIGVLLTGDLETKGVNLAGDRNRQRDELYGQPIARNILGVYHQHFFNFRLDLDIDGIRNSVTELNVQAAAPRPANPNQNAFTVERKDLRTEEDGRRELDLAASRTWKIFNPSVKNALGEPVAYKVIPGENAVAYAGPEAWVRKRAGFISAPVWVTRYDPSELHAAGYYVNQSRGGGGLPAWVKANRGLTDEDVVFWYTLGVTHIPRPEQWPVMNVERVHFMLVPCGFFDQNPALGVPRTSD